MTEESFESRGGVIAGPALPGWSVHCGRPWGVVVVGIASVLILIHTLGADRP